MREAVCRPRPNVGWMRGVPLSPPEGCLKEEEEEWSSCCHDQDLRNQQTDTDDGETPTRCRRTAWRGRSETLMPMRLRESDLSNRFKLRMGRRPCADEMTKRLTSGSVERNARLAWEGIVRRQHPFVDHFLARSGKQ